LKELTLDKRREKMEVVRRRQLRSYYWNRSSAFYR